MDNGLQYLDAEIMFTILNGLTLKITSRYLKKPLFYQFIEKDGKYYVLEATDRDKKLRVRIVKKH
jgi:hypothetical protein